MLEQAEYKELSIQKISRALFKNFERHQVVTKCLRKVDGAWVVADDPFIDQWNEAEYANVVEVLKNTLRGGGFVYAAYVNGSLKGFASVEALFLGAQREYLDLPYLHVSEDMRGRGIGKNLFQAAAAWARRQGAKKLYISAHSSVESQAFYRAMGCVEAKEYNPVHVESEPYDCQLEYVL